MGDDDGHLTLYELIEHLHSLAGMVLYIHRERQSFNHFYVCLIATFTCQTVFVRLPHLL